MISRHEDDCVFNVSRRFITQMPCERAHDGDAARERSWSSGRRPHVSSLFSVLRRGQLSFFGSLSRAVLLFSSCRREMLDRFHILHNREARNGFPSLRRRFIMLLQLKLKEKFPKLGSWKVIDAWSRFSVCWRWQKRLPISKCWQLFWGDEKVQKLSSQVLIESLLCSTTALTQTWELMLKNPWRSTRNHNC